MPGMVDAAREVQSAGCVFMVRPASFGANAETRGTNAFQGAAEGEPAAVAARARAEFDALVATLRAAGIAVEVLEDTPEPPRPDAVFPNNWISFHADGTAVLYPMLVPSRRTEVRPEFLDELARRGRFHARRVLDLREGTAEVLEGTGSLVLDRVARVAYACRSSRTSEALLARFCRELGYEAVLFHAVDRGGVPVYHTNVMLSVGTAFAVLCAEAIPDPDERARVRARLAAGGRELIEIDLDQMGAFAGNVLEVRAGDGRACLVLSARARGAFTPSQRVRLERHARLVSSDLTTIETCGGGSARCMLAELHGARDAGSP